MSQEFTQLLMTDLAFLSEMTQELSYHDHMDGLLQSLIKKTRDLLLDEMEYNRDLVDLKILVLGEFNSGKSSVINSILQEKVCPVGAKPNTHRFTNVSYGERLKFLHGQQEISFREYNSLVQAPVVDNVRDVLNIKSPAAILKGISLVDTPGLSNPLQNHQGDSWVLTQLPISDVAFLIVNAHDRSGIFHSLNTLNQKKNINPRLRWHLVLNRTDSLKTEQVEDLKSLIQNRYPDWFDSILYHTQTNENLMSLLRRLSMDRLEILRSRRIRAQAEYKAMRTDVLQRVHKTLKIPTDLQKNRRFVRQYLIHLQAMTRDWLLGLQNDSLLLPHLFSEGMQKARLLTVKEVAADLCFLKVIESKLMKLLKDSRVMQILFSEPLPLKNSLRNRVSRINSILAEEQPLRKKLSQEQVNGLTLEQMNRFLLQTVMEILSVELWYCLGFWSGRQEWNQGAILRMGAYIKEGACA